MEDDLYAQELDNYVKQHNIHKILRESIVNVCLYRPDDPIRFLREYFEALDVCIICSFGACSCLCVQPNCQNFSFAL